MSDFLAEARVVVRPDTTRFRTELLTAVTAATRTPIPIAVTPVLAGGTRGLATVTAQANTASTAVNQLAAAQLAAGAAATKSASQIAAQTRTVGNLERAAFASAAGMTGLRGAVLTAGGAFLAATVGIQAFGRAVQSAANLESNLNVFRVTAGATADEMERVRDTAKALGRDLELPGVTASDAAETFLTLSRAGLSVQDALDGARGTLQLAVAAQISFADAAQLTASALNAFGLQGDAAVSVADTLTNAANQSQASIADMGIALRQSAAIADLAGFSFSETATFLTQLAQAGLSGSDAGTSFRVAIQRLIAPTGAARDALESLRINLRDAQGNLRPEAFFELGDALERMGRAQADATRQLIFGNDASRAAAFFARINAEAFRANEKSLQKQGSAAEVAGARNAGFSGKVENLKNQITALGTEIGELALPGLGLAADTTAAFFGALATQIADSREAIAGFGEDAEKLGVFLRVVSDDSGFTDFVGDVASGARLIAGDIARASDATDRFAGRLLGIDPPAQKAAEATRDLAQNEALLGNSIRDADGVLTPHIANLGALRTAAEEAAGAVGRLTGQIAGIEEGVTRARISGDETSELSLLQEQRERIERLLAIEENIVAEGGKGAATARERIRNQILPELEGVNNEINAIIAQQAADARALADDAERARDERDRNIIDAIGGRESKRRNAVIRAQATATLKDDIQAQIALRNFYRSAIEEVRKTVTDAKQAAQIISSLIADQIRANQEIEAARQQLKEQRQQERQEARERRRERLSLNVQIAEATGNQSAEIRARNAEIEFLKEQIRQTRRGSLQRKRLILELRQAQAELKELQQAGEQTGDARKQAAEFFFSQLQAQQGFAANLLGNLITGPTAGLVGVPSPGRDTVNRPDLESRTSAEVSAATGRGQIGPTGGQANTEISVLGKILQELRKLNGSYDAPEAIHQKKVGAGNMDNFAM